MYKHPNELFIRALFHDALNGEFYLQSDHSKKRSHTLGRLGIASVLRGKMFRVDDEVSGFEHRPGWAPRVVATAYCNLDERDVLFLTQLVLNDGNDNQVLFSDAIVPPDLARGISVSGTNSLIVPLHHEEQHLRIVRTDMARIAKDFFDNAARHSK